MKRRVWRTSLILAALAAGSAIPAIAAPISFAGQSMEANGSAALAGSTLRLTPNAGNQAGSAFISTPFTVTGDTSFSTDFQFNIHDGSGADGLTFTVQNAGAGGSTLGAAGGGLGYGGITPSLAVEFDTFNNGEPAVPHIAIDSNGSLASSTTASVANLRNASLFAWIDYDGSSDLLSIFFNTSNTKPGVALIAQSYDLTGLGSQAYFGFTAGTGGATDIHDIEAWNLSVSTPSAVPVPASLPLMGSALAALGLWRRRKRA